MTKAHEGRTVLFLSPSAYPLGGVAVWLDYLLPALGRAGWRAVLGLAAGHHHDAKVYLAQHPYQDAVLVHNPTGSSQGRMNALADTIRNVSPDVVLVVNLVDVYPVVRRMRSRGSAPRVVMALHGLQGDLIEDISDADDVLDGVIATNRLSCALAAARRRQPERVLYAPCGVEVHPEGGEGMRRRVSPDPLKILFCGRVDQSQKRVFDLVDVLATLTARGGAATITIAGAGPEEDALRARCERFGLADRVKFLGALDRFDLFAQYDAHHALLITSAWETGPLVAWEAMAHGLPVVSSRYVGSGREGALRNGVNCLTFAIGDTAAAADALLSLSDEGTRARIAREGRGLVGERYTRERSVSQWLEALEKIFALPPLPVPGSTPATASSGRLDRILGPSLGERVRRGLGFSHPHVGPGGEWPHTANGEIDQETFLTRAGQCDTAEGAP